MQTIPTPEPYEQKLPATIWAALKAFFEAGRQAGIHHAEGRHDLENAVITLANNQAEVCVEDITRVGSLIDGLLYADAAAASIPDTIPGDWRMA